MKLKLLLLVFSLVFFGGCASTQFSVVGKDEYRLFKMSDACAVGSPSVLLDYLRGESVKFCAGRKESPVEISSNTEMGIPIVRCTSAELTFRCEPIAKE